MSHDIAAPPVYQRVRMTIPARELLQQGGNIVELDPDETRHRAYTVTLAGRVPAPRLGLTLVLVGRGHEQHYALRLASEPPYPDEWPAGAVPWYLRGEWVPCPRCGGALVWYEAGYVPGYRLCTRGHHAKLSDDGRSARRARP